MAKSKKIIPIISLAFICLASGIGIGFLIGKNSNKLKADEQDLIDEYNILKDEWLYGTSQTDYSKIAMEGLAYGYYMEGEDNFTFYTKTEAEQGLDTTYCGFGFAHHSYNGGLYVTEIQNNSSALANGLQVKDVIYGVNSDSNFYDFKEHSLNEIETYLSECDDNKTYQFKVERDEFVLYINMKKQSYDLKLVEEKSVPTKENNYTLTIKINKFLGDMANEVENIIDKYLNITENLVLDLRENPGGYISQAEMLSELFVKKGTLIYKLLNKNSEVVSQAYQMTDPKYSIPNYYILQDGGSASASEIFTLAMRAGCSCKVLGFKSYGKGVAQNFKEFSDGSILRYTYAYVYGPEREDETMYDEKEDSDDIICIDHKGIIPDVEYTFDYQFLADVYCYYDSLSISESAIKHFNKVCSYLYPESFLDNSCIFYENLKTYVSLAFEDEIEIYSSDGKINKTIDDYFVKQSFDSYLLEESKFDNYILGVIND